MIGTSPGPSNPFRASCFARRLKNNIRAAPGPLRREYIKF